MSDLPHQVRMCFAALLGVLVLIAGCAQHEAMKPTRQETAVFAAGALRVEVAGALTAMLPHYDATPALQAFLYGPSDYGKTALRNPQGMCLVGQRLLVGDQNYPAIVAIDLTTGRSWLWEKGDARCRCPVALVTDGLGKVYVADTTLRAVLVYDVNGQLLNTLQPDAASAPQFRPAALAWHDGVLYVGNVGDRRIERYARVPTLETPAQPHPRAATIDVGSWMAPITNNDTARIVAPCGLAVLPDGELLVADAVLGTLNRFSPTGWALGTIARSSRGEDGLIRPKQVAVCQGWIFVADAGRQSVQVYGLNGQWQMEITGQARGWAGWTLPAGLLACELPQPAGEPSATSTGPVLLVSDGLGPVSITMLRIRGSGSATQEARHAP